VFKNKTQLLTKVTPDMIASNSDYVWLIFFGELPSYGKRFYSPFRSDRKAGCRWSYNNNQWWLVDNAGHNGKLAWSIYDFVSWLYPTYTAKEVYHLIASRLVETVPNIQTIRRPNVASVKDNNIIIKFEYTDWTEDDYFSRMFDIDLNYLNQQPYYKVVNYWANSRKDNTLRKNPFHSPKSVETIAYYFEDTDHTKLYFPAKNDFKWYSNCNADDIFGEHRLKEYDNSHIVITKSAKDEMILNYHCNLQTLAVQSEAITSNKKLNDLCNQFSQKIIYFDNDDPGRRNSKTLGESVGALCIFNGDTEGKDAAEFYALQNNKEKFKEGINNKFK